MSSNVGKRIVNMVWEDLIPSKIITEKSVDNAVTIAMAMGCSTNAIIHLIAMARRAGINLTMDDLDKKGREVPLNCKHKTFRERLFDGRFFYAGGILALMHELSSKLNLDEKTVSGKTVRELIVGNKTINEDVIRP